MKHPLVIKLIMRRYGLNRKQFAEKLGDENPIALFGRINRGQMRIDRLIDIMDALGYQLVFQPKGRESMPEWSYPIRWSDYNSDNIEE